MSQKQESPDFSRGECQRNNIGIFEARNSDFLWKWKKEATLRWKKLKSLEKETSS
jgi:hypothetical protein